MPPASTSDTSRAPVQTYVPEYQKAKWERHAEELDMTTSEFVRSMVQAGRRGFEGTGVPRADPGGETPSSGPDPGGKRLEDRVEAVLSDGAAHDWDDLLQAVTDDVEERLDAALEAMQRDNRVTYSGRDGGYVLE